MKYLTERKTIQDPPIARFLFGDTRMALVWFALRLYIGYDWIEAASHKVTDPGWVDTGKSLQAFWVKAATIPAPPAKPAVTFDWYRGFLQLLIDSGSSSWFGKVIAYGELLVGIALVAGAFVGVAAVAGAFMNMNFMLAGSASSNPILFLGAALLILAWKTAGYIGLDSILLPALGTPWKAREPKETARSVPRPATL